MGQTNKQKGCERYFSRHHGARADFTVLAVVLAAHFRSPIFRPNSLNSASILGRFLRKCKNRPEIEVLLRGLGQKIGLLKMMSKYPLSVKKVGICPSFLRALFLP